MMMSKLKSSLLILFLVTLCCRRRAMANQVIAIPSMTNSMNDNVRSNVMQSHEPYTVQRGLRPTKNTKSEDSDFNHKEKEDPTDLEEPKDTSKGSDPTTSATNSSGDTKTSTDTTIVEESDIKMRLGGVDPLDPKARTIWEGVTGDFIIANIVRFSKDVSLLELSVHFDSQSPPYQGSTLRAEPPGASDRTAEITFDVRIEIGSKVTNPDAKRYVAHAFNTNSRKTTYMRRLLATGDPAFADVGSVSVETTTSSSEKVIDAKEIGAIVGIAFVGVAFVATALYVMFGIKKSHASRGGDGAVVEGKDNGSDYHAKTMTATSISDDDESAEPAEDDEIPASVSADDASHYYDGNISVTWSMATDMPQTPQTTNNKVSLLGGWSRDSSESSLFADDNQGEEAKSAPLRGAPRQKAHHLVQSSSVGKLYEV